MVAIIARRGFLLKLLGLAGAGVSAGLAIGKTLKAERRVTSPVLYFNGRSWHTHEKIDHLAGTWDIRWCYRSACEHTVEQTGTTEDGYRIWHLKSFHKPPDPLPGDAIPPGSIDRTPPLRRYFQDDDDVS
ncbi:MAG: hypothetical protein WCC53_14040 [Thermoanaerobaculia bacterium]